MFDKFRFAAAVAASIACWSCGWGSDGTGRLKDTYPSQPADDAQCGQVSADAALGEVGGEGSSGLWAMRVDQHGTFSPAGSEWDIVVTDVVMVSFADFPPDASGMVFTFCDQPNEVDTHGNDILKPVTAVPQVLKDSVPPLAIPFDDAVSDGTPAMRVVWLWGVQGLDDPEKDPVPDKPDSPFVWDQDGDGNPGVTIEVQAPVPGHRYMARRAIWDLDPGVMSGDGQWITGTLKFQIEEKALGADETVLNTVAPIASAADGNRFQMRRIPGDWTCEDLVSRYPDMFEDAP